MIDRLFLATLTFCLLIAGALAIGSELVGTHREPAAQIVQFETVVVTGKRLAPQADVAITERVEPAAQRAQ